MMSVVRVRVMRALGVLWLGRIQGVSFGPSPFAAASVSPTSGSPKARGRGTSEKGMS
jgi:hypothetical protein